jgi:peptidoglycan hydrolase FlgJ
MNLSLPLPIAANPAALPPNGPSMKTLQTAREFESVFIGQLVGLMMEQVPTEGPFGGGHAEATFRGLLAEEMGKSIAKQGGIGLTRAVMDEMIRLQSQPPEVEPTP